MKMDKTEIIEYINTLKCVQGYIQMSDKPISDIWQNSSDISNFAPKSGFIYEAHFWNESEKKSFSIKQINSDWLVSTTDLTDSKYTVDFQKYKTAIKNFDYDVKMAQIWEEEADKNCDGKKVKKLKKVVFAGFAKGEKQ